MYRVRIKRVVAELRPISFLIYLLIALWLLAMIAIPILLWTVGKSALPWGMSISVALQAGTVLAILVHGLGWRPVLRIMAIILPFSWLLEVIGSSTGLPFGFYYYTDLLIPQFRHVPLIIPFSWLMMLAPSWAIAEQICDKSKGPAFVLLSGLAMMAWDLYLDPQMVGWGFWVWEEQAMFLGGYFGIPWLNYFGWTLGAALLTWLVTLVVDLEPLFWRSKGGHKTRVQNSMPLRVIYMATWLLEVGGLALFWGLVGPAACGFVGMGSLIGWGWLEGMRRRQMTRSQDG